MVLKWNTKSKWKTRFRKDYNANFYKNYKLTFIKLVDNFLLKKILSSNSWSIFMMMTLLNSYIDCPSKFDQCQLVIFKKNNVIIFLKTRVFHHDFVFHLSIITPSRRKVWSKATVLLEKRHVFSVFICKNASRAPFLSGSILNCVSLDYYCSFIFYHELVSLPLYWGPPTISSQSSASAVASASPSLSEALASSGFTMKFSVFPKLAFSTSCS